MSGLFDLDKLAKQVKNGRGNDDVNYNGEINGGGTDDINDNGGNDIKKKYIRKSYIKKDDTKKSVGKKTSKNYSYEDLHKKYVEVLPENYNKFEVKDYIRWINKDGSISDGFTISSIDDKKFKIKNRTGDFTFDPSLFNKIYKFNKVINIRNTGIITPDGIIPFDNSQMQNQQMQNSQMQNSQMQNSPKDDVLSQIGNKLLFDDSHVIKLDIDNINNKIKKMETDIKNMFKLLKQVYNTKTEQ